MSELLKTNPNGQWELLEKSGYGPKGAGAYTVADNVHRKRKNTGEESAVAGPNRNVKQYGGFGGKKLADVEDKKIKALNRKQPVKQYSPEELAAENAKRKLGKSENIEFTPNGQWSLT